MTQAYKRGPDGIYYTDPPVDPSDVITVGVAWKHELPSGVTVTSAAWTVTAPVTQSGSSINAAQVTDTDGVAHAAGTVTTVRLAGFTAGSTHRVTVHVVWSDGQERDRSIDIVSKQR